MGPKLRELRLAKGMPAAALDERFGLQRGDWDSWEQGYKEPEEELLEEIAGYFGVSVRDLSLPPAAAVPQRAMKSARS